MLSLCTFKEFGSIFSVPSCYVVEGQPETEQIVFFPALLRFAVLSLHLMSAFGLIQWDRHLALTWPVLESSGWTYC